MKKNARRGLAPIIGTMFVVMLTVSALAATVSVVQQQQRATTETAQETNRFLDSLSEKIDISQTRVINDRLNLTLSNAGDTVARVKSIYIVNETASPDEQYRYDVDLMVDGRSDITNVGQTLPFVASSTTSYTVRIVTESGNSASSVYYPFILTPLLLSLSIIPPVITTGENVSLLYTITNNLTSNEPLTVSPTISNSVTCEGSQLCTATKLTSAPSEVTIEKGSFVIVKETYKIEGPPGTTVTFNASFAEAEAGNYVTEDARVIIVASTFEVNNAIATAPDIYLTVPGPFGDTDESASPPHRGLWGVTVVNPTTNIMKVYRVLITVLTAAHAGDAVIYSSSSSSPCSPSAITPTSNWDCPHNNQIQWKNLGSPETLNAGQSMSFLVRVEPAELGSSEEPGATVIATVYTDIGVFTNAGYTTAMRDVDAPLGNVYLTDTITTTAGSEANTALGNSHVLGEMSNIASNTNTTFYVAIADFDRRSSRTIETGAKLIINVPPGFANVTVTSWDKFVTKPAITIRADGVTQIIGITTEPIGDSTNDSISGGTLGSEVAVIRFAAITPSPSEDTIYIMIAYVDGKSSPNSTDQISVGAIAEIPLQVNGTG